LEIHITSDWHDNNAVIVFKDNGIGIDLERNKDKIFGLYQRFHSHTEGKGLGLYLVKSQVESMGGTINIESEVDKGTTFKITFNNN
jgi:signal transduction histidine kinase